MRDGFQRGYTMIDIIAIWELILDRYHLSGRKPPRGLMRVLVAKYYFAPEMN